MVTCSSILAWRIPWTEEPGMLQSIESQRIGHDLAHMHAQTDIPIPFSSFGYPRNNVFEMEVIVFPLKLLFLQNLFFW